MAQGIERLSAVEVKQAKPDPSGKARILADGGGLRLVVRPNGARYWQFKTAKGGKETTLQLGTFPETSLAEARAKAAAVRKQQSEGLDPLTERRLYAIKQKSAQDTTFQSVAEELITVKKKNGISASYIAKIEGSIKANLTPRLGVVPIQKIETPFLKDVLRPNEARGSLDMLRFVLSIAGEIFDLAKSNGYFRGDNPAHALRSNVFAKHVRGHMAALPWSEMNGFMHRLDACQHCLCAPNDADRDPPWRSARSQLEGVRSGRVQLDHPGRAHERSQDPQYPPGQTNSVDAARVAPAHR